MSTESTTPANVKFLTINEFKLAIGANADEKAQVIKNPNGGKIFLTIGSQNFKCQQTIDGAKEMKMIVNDDNYSDACLSNVKPNAENILFSL